MKIVHIVPGSGGTFYCQNCLRDEALILQCRQMGHDVILVPMYLPRFKAGLGVQPDAPVFYGAINTYLKEKLTFFTFPKWLEKALNASFLLDWAGSKAGSTRSKGLEQMTLSVLLGEDGNQAAELEKMVAWLKTETKPDVIHISNALLIGIAHRIKEELQVPIICTLQDEHTWVDDMEENYRNLTWKTMSEKAKDIDAFISVSHYFKEFMQKRMDIADSKIHVVHVGTPLTTEEPSNLPFKPPVIGYLSPLSKHIGLEHLIEAFIKVKQTPGLETTRLKAFGGQTADDKKFLLKMKKKLARLGFDSDVDFLPTYDPEQKIDFLNAITILSVPNHHGEAFGIYLIEAMALGIPVVQPNCGAFPELIHATGGGMLYDQNQPDSLSKSLIELLQNPEQVKKLGNQGRKTVAEHFSIEAMAKKMIGIYEKL